MTLDNTTFNYNNGGDYGGALENDGTSATVITG